MRGFLEEEEEEEVSLSESKSSDDSGVETGGEDEITDLVSRESMTSISIFMKGLGAKNKEMPSSYRWTMPSPEIYQ